MAGFVALAFSPPPEAHLSVNISSQAAARAMPLTQTADIMLVYEVLRHNTQLLPFSRVYFIKAKSI